MTHVVGLSYLLFILAVVVITFLRHGPDLKSATGLAFICSDRRVMGKMVDEMMGCQEED